MNIRAVASTEASRISEIIDHCRHLEGPMLPILHQVQEEFGYIPESAKQLIASALNVSRAEVHGVITSTTIFAITPRAPHLKLCRAEACQSMGGDRLAERAKARLGLDWHKPHPMARSRLSPSSVLASARLPRPRCWMVSFMDASMSTV